MYAWCRMEKDGLGRRRVDDDYGIHPECVLYVHLCQPRPEPTYTDTQAHNIIYEG